MVMNITIDDTAGVLVYSDGWRVQPSPTSQFFQGTYHASQSTNQTVSVTFNGTAVYIYGSKGTTYGDFKVEIDNVINFNSSSLPENSSPEVEYQQLLYSNTFAEGTHLVELTTTSDSWVDIDYITLTSVGPDEGTDPGSFSSTVSALSPSSQTVLTASTSSVSAEVAPTANPSSSNSAATTNSITLALTGVFGGLLLLLLFGLLGYRLVSRHRQAQYDRERDFRRGGSASNVYGGPSAALVSPKPDNRSGIFSGLMGGGSRGGGSTGTNSGRNSSVMGEYGINRSNNVTPLSAHQHIPMRPAQPRMPLYNDVGPAGMQYVHAPSPYRDPRESIDFLSVRS